MVHADINVLKDRQIEHSVPLARIKGLFLAGVEKNAAIDAHIVLRVLQVLQQKLAEYFLLECQVRITLQVELDHVLLVVVVVVIIGLS